MTDTDILRLAEPFISMRDTAQPMIHGRDAICDFSRIVLKEFLRAAANSVMHEDVNSLSARIDRERWMLEKQIEMCGVRDEQRRQQNPA